MSNQNNKSSASYKFNSGDIFVGRTADKIGKAVRVEGPDGCRVKVRHHGTNILTTVDPVSLYSSFRPARDGERVPTWSEPVATESFEVEMNGDTVGDAEPRKIGQRRTMRKRAILDPASDNAVNVAAADAAPVSPKSPPAESWQSKDGKTTVIKIPFLDDFIFTVWDGKKTSIVVNPACGQMGLSTNHQGTIIRNRRRCPGVRYEYIDCDISGTNRYTRALLCVDLPSLDLWLDSIDPYDPRGKSDADAVAAYREGATKTVAAYMQAHYGAQTEASPKAAKPPASATFYNFCGYAIPSAVVDGDTWIKARHIAETVGINHPTLFQRLKRLPVTETRMVVVPGWGQTNEVHALRASYLPQFILKMADASRQPKDTETWGRWLAEARRILASSAAQEPTAENVATASNEEPDAQIADAMPDGMALAKYDGVPLAVPMQSQGEALIRDITLGTRLGLSRPRDIRKTIENLKNSGLLGVTCERASKARSLTPTGGVHEVDVTEYWLTEKQALRVIRRSESPMADLIMDEVTDVFLAWRHGRLPNAAPPMDMAALVSATVSATATQMVPVIIEAVMARLPSQPASTGPDSEQMRRDAETLRRQRSNAAKKAAATKDVNAMIDAVKDDLAPLIHRFTSERMTRADTRVASDVNRCLRPNEMLQQFNAYLRAASTKLSPSEQETLAELRSEDDMHNRVLYTLFNHVSNGVKAEKEIEEDGETRMVQVLPWIPKVGAVPNPRQTAIPGTSNLPIPRTPLPPALRWAPGGSGAAPADTGAVVPVPIAEGPQMECSDSTTTNRPTVPHRGRGFNRKPLGVL